MTELVVARANPTQAAEICNVIRRSIQEVCGPDYNNDPHVLAQWLANKTPNNISEWIKSKHNYPVVVVHQSNIVGFAMARDDEILLNYVAPEYLGQGAGRLMLVALETWARQRGLSSLKCISTITAKGFYEKQGFSEAGDPQNLEDVLGEFPLSKPLST